MTGPRTIFVQGDAQRIPLADGSVHCAVCSPPFFALRAYGTTPRVWGGSDFCRHEWGGNGECTLDSPGDGVNIRFDKKLGQFCTHCNGWHGELGQEPDPRLFVAHLVEVFREVRLTAGMLEGEWLGHVIAMVKGRQ